MNKSFKHCVPVISTCIILFLFNMHLNAQHTPAAYTATTQVSYVRTWDAMAPEPDANTLMTRPLKEVKQATQYLDGLGRPLQTVVKQGSMATNGTANDLVSPVEYDEFGREQYKHLPFVANNTGGNASITDGNFKINPFQQQVAFMNAQYGTQAENYFYSKTNFEPSPLNRVNDSYAPGSSWAGSEINAPALQRNVQMKYSMNTAVDAVQIWTVTDNITLGEFGTYATTAGTGIYAAGELNKNITTDEHKKQVIEFKDKAGKVILKKVQLTATADDGTGSGYTGWLCTYYIYDSFDNLRCVIQPKGVEILSQNGWVIDYSPSGLGAEQCFRYEYDSRNRMIKKKVPGSAAVSIVYDTRDRAVLTQDGNLAASGKWAYMQYDDLNRPIASGLWPSALTWAQHSAIANSSISYPALSGQEELSRTFYDDYTWLPANGNPFAAARSTTDDVYLNAATTVYPYYQAVTQSNATKGMVTGTKTKVLGSASTYLYGISYYDEKGRVIQIQSQNITTGIDIATTQYNWSGQPLLTVMRQQKNGTNPQTHILITKIQYDDLGRVLNVKKTVNSTINSVAVAKPEQLIVQNEYDQLGQLKKKTLGNANLETLNYDYNIRGWMLGVNRDYAKDLNSTNFFGFDLGYEKANNNIIGSQSYSAPQYNGNIEGMVWKSKGDGEKRKYDFGYDAANRILKADFTQYTGGTFNQTAGVNYNLKMGDGTNVSTAYDANGNILQLQQWGLKLTASQQIDNLSYLYQTNSNKLARVTDANNDAATKLGDFKDGTNTGTDDYTYDANGNLNLDNNKAISSIVCNHLNLPSVITVTGKGTIAYTYDAGGNKMKKVTTEGAKITTTLYLGGSVYQNDTLQFVAHEEGRVRWAPLPGGAGGGSFQFDYMLKDHLGNIRMVLTEELKQDIYPAATLENITFNGGTAITNESPYYNIDNTKIVTQATATGIPVYQNNNGITNNNPYSNTAANSARLYQLNAATNTVPNKTGFGIVLKVMAGDNLNIFGKSYHKKPTAGYTLATSPLAVLDLMNLFAGAPALSGKGITGTQITGQSGFPTSVTTLLNNQPAQTTTTPRASINWIILDEQFKYVSGGFDMVLTAVNSTGSFKSHTVTGIQIPKNGYIYVYCSNESQYNVFFDNLQVVHNRGPILEETHYNSWGMTLAGISSKSAGGITNKYKFTGKEEQRQEFVDGSGLEWTDFGARMYDNQIGRWHVIDLKSEKYVTFTPYNYSANNPIRYIDVDGKDFVDAKGNKMTYTLDKKGNMVWSSNTSADVKRLSKIMQMTTTSKESFNAMYNSDIKVHFSFSPKVDKVVKDNGDGTGSTIYHYGVTKKGNDTPPDYGQKQSANGTYGVTETNVTVFEGSIKEAQKLKIGVFANLTLDEAIATQVSHEKVHAVDKDQINGEMQKTYDKKPFDNEKKPTENEKKVIEELKKQKSN
jgi:RHS repeat-associated protein